MTSASTAFAAWAGHPGSPARDLDRFRSASRSAAGSSETDCPAN